MQEKIIKFGDTEHQKMLRGANAVADAMKISMGPKGKYIVIPHNSDVPAITKNGIRIAGRVTTADSFEHTGSVLMNEAIFSMADSVGDFTKTAAVITQAIVQEGMRHAAEGRNLRKMRVGIDRAVNAAVLHLFTNAYPVLNEEQLIQVGSTAANGDRTIGTLLASAFRQIGPNGTILIEEGNKFEDKLGVKEGLRIDSGFALPELALANYFEQITFENVLIAVVAEEIERPRELWSLLNLAVASEQPLLIVADAIPEHILSLGIMNISRSALKVCIVNTTGEKKQRRELLEDLATMTGAALLSSNVDFSLKELGSAVLGRAKRVSVTRDCTTIISGRGDRGIIAARVRQLYAQKREASAQACMQLEQRIARLSGAVATIKVGAPTKMAIRERKERMESAHRAMQAAMEEGVVPGAGLALLHTQPSIKQCKGTDPDVNAGIDAILHAVEAPLRHIALNAEADPSAVLEKSLELGGNYGFNAVTGEYENLCSVGIVDPTKMVRTALQHAATTAKLLTTTDCLSVRHSRVIETTH